MWISYTQQDEDLAFSLVSCCPGDGSDARGLGETELDTVPLKILQCRWSCHNGDEDERYGHARISLLSFRWFLVRCNGVRDIDNADRFWWLLLSIRWTSSKRERDLIVKYELISYSPLLSPIRTVTSCVETFLISYNCAWARLFKWAN